MKSPLRYFAVLVVLFGQACTDEAPTGPALSDEAGLELRHGRGESDAITVMTQNLYVGADVDAVIPETACPAFT